MTKDELLKYLKSAIDLETDIATQESIINEYNKISLAKKPQLILKEEPSQPPAPIYIDYNAWDKKNHDDGKAVAVVFGVCGLVVGIPCIFFTPVLGIIFTVAGLCCFMPLHNKKQEVTSENDSRKLHYENAMQRYHEQLESIKKSNEESKQIYNYDLNIWNKSDSKNRAILNEPLSKTKLLLEKLYTNDFIYAKYRSLPALTSIYEYLLTGRCDELAGAHGAYNLYEDEVRKDTVISQLNTIIDNLEQIKQNQYMLYQQATMIKNETFTIRRELQEIKGYTIDLTELAALNTYYSALTARNSEISAAYHLLNG